MAQVTGSTAAMDRSALPRPIKKARGRVDRRLRRQSLLKGLGTAGLIAAIGAAAGMAADLAFDLPLAARWGIWGAWVLALALPLLAGLARALGRRTNDLALAGVLEQSDATLGDRLTGAVDLLEGPSHGSPELIAALADDAAARVSAVDPTLAAPSGKAWRRLALGALAVAIVAAPGVWKDDPFGTLARRFLAPWKESDRVGLFTVTVEPGDIVVAKGDDVKISPRRAPIHAARLGRRSRRDVAGIDGRRHRQSSSHRDERGRRRDDRVVHHGLAEGHGVADVPGREPIGRESEAHDHGRRPAESGDCRGASRAAGLYQVPGRRRAQRRADRGD